MRLSVGVSLVIGLVVAPLAFAGVQEGTAPTPVVVVQVPADPPRAVPGDEIDRLADELKPKARFESYQPAWRVESRTFTFQQANGPETKTWPVVFDGDKPVAIVRSGDILLIARTPATATTKLALPTERLHLDNLPGPSLPTHQFIKNVKTHGSIYSEQADKVAPQERWEAGPRSLTFVREQHLPEARDGDKVVPSLDVLARFVFTVDPVFGYRVDAIRDVRFGAQPAGKAAEMGGGSFCPGCYVPWKHAAIYARTAWTPVSGGISGWANNLLTMDRCDAGKDFAWRDGGFIAYLPAPDGWSPCFTRQDGTGNTPNLAVCNAHNDFHIKFILKDLPKTEDGKYRYYGVHRLLSLPPELTAAVWERMSLIQKDAKAIIIKLGEVEDFENQPVPLTEPARGLVWTSNEPPIVNEARSGKQAIKVAGRQWPNLPQVSLQPDTRYRLEGWYKVTPWTAEQVAAAKAREDARRADLEKKKQAVPPPTDWSKLTPQAYIEGDFYQWSPYTEKMMVKQKTSVATPESSDWQHVVLEFDSPAWGPFINIAFVAEHCDAILDDFALTAIGPATSQPAARGGD